MGADHRTDTLRLVRLSGGDPEDVAIDEARRLSRHQLHQFVISALRQVKRAVCLDQLRGARVHYADDPLKPRLRCRSFTSPRPRYREYVHAST